MADIEKLIQDLQSDDIEKRYDACKQLQVESHFPKEAIGALRKASKDPDPLVAVAAQRALENHGAETPAIRHVGNGQVPEVSTDKKEQISLTCSYRIGLSVWAAFISGISLIVLSVLSLDIVETYIYTYQFDPLNYFFGTAIILIPTTITSVIATGILFYIWEKPILLFGNFVFTIVLISTIIGMICAMLWWSVAIGLVF